MKKIIVDYLIKKCQNEGVESLTIFEKRGLLIDKRFQLLSDKSEEFGTYCNCLTENFEAHKTERDEEGLCILCGHYTFYAQKVKS